jgi:hypothetical protein
MPRNSTARTAATTHTQRDASPQPQRYSKTIPTQRRARGALNRVRIRRKFVRALF